MKFFTTLCKKEWEILVATNPKSFRILGLMRKSSIVYTLFLAGLSALLLGCNFRSQQDEMRKDWAQITRTGKLTLLTENSTLSFFEFKGKRMGFEYEILDTFCKAHHLKLEVKVVNKLGDFVRMLRKGEGDVVAANLPIALRQQKYFNYSIPYYQTYQVLVQRKSDSIISEPAYLAGKTVYIRKNSAYEKRLLALQEEIGATIDIRYQKTAPLAEDLIEEVANGQIHYTLAHENQARIVKDMHPNLDIATRMSFEQRIAFALRPKSKILKEKLDAFLQTYIASEAYTQLKKRYFDYIASTPTEFYLTPKGALSPFDALFKKAAQAYNWDWKVLAAVAFKESRFNPNARGFGGAYGLMQFMPNTGPQFGVFPESSPEVQIRGGMRYLQTMSKRWASISDEQTRLQFTLASYNAGMSHIEDAQRLARAAGLNPNVWDGNVALMVNKLDEPQYYRSELVRCGAYRGQATTYVAKVLAIYARWK
jgi:membrane-bound lytic murein transglycosylase F